MHSRHCTNSTSKIYPDNDWVKVEVEVLGSERVRHLIDGQTVLEYEKPMIGGGVANGYDPAIKKDGTFSTPATSRSRPKASRSSSGTSGC